MPNYISNQFLLNNLVNLNKARFLKSLETCKNSVYLLNKIYFKNNRFHKTIYRDINDVYNIDIYLYDLKTIKSRIEFVQLHEV